MTPKELNQTLVHMIESVVEHLIPGGVRMGREYCVGSVGGEPGKSLKVCMDGTKKGLWSDFATGEKGDLLDLWKLTREIPFVDVLKEAQSFAGIDEGKHIHRMSPLNRTKPPRPEGITKPKEGLLGWAGDRGIKETTLKRFKVAQRQEAAIFPYISPAGEIEMYKYRTIREKKIWTNKDPYHCLFGWQAVSDDTRSVIICEGEFDAMAWYEAGLYALSVPFGGGTGKKQAWLDNEYNNLNRFDTIYLSMDADTMGRVAVETIVSRLGHYRCKIISLPSKDANECLLKPGGAEVLRSAPDQARHLDPAELKEISRYTDEVINEIHPPQGTPTGITLPWPKTFDEFRFRPGESTAWAGINGHGKSTVLNQTILDGMSHGERSCTASMEMLPAPLTAMTVRQVTAKAVPSRGEIKAAMEGLCRMAWVVELYGSAKGKRILEIFEYAYRRYGVTQFIVDSLAKCGFAEDDYNSQKQFVEDLADFARKFKVHTHIVIHIRKKDSEDKPPNKMDLKGTGAITDMVDNVLIVWRNKPKERALRKGDETAISRVSGEPDATLSCVKQRKTGVEPYYALWFSPGTQLYRGAENDPPKEYLA